MPGRGIRCFSSRDGSVSLGSMDTSSLSGPREATSSLTRYTSRRISVPWNLFQLLAGAVLHLYIAGGMHDDPLCRGRLWPLGGWSFSLLWDRSLL
jgi:hypothetical protein